MAQVIFDHRDRFSARQHSDRTRMTKTVDRIDIFETLRAQGFGKILSTNTIDTMPGKFRSPLVDKQAVLMQRFGFYTIFGNVEGQESAGFRVQFDQSEAVAFTQDGQRILAGIEIVEIKGGNFMCSGAGVIEQTQDGIIAKTILLGKVNLAENF